MGLLAWMRRKSPASAANDSQLSGLYSRLEGDSRFGSGYGELGPASGPPSQFPASPGLPVTPATRFNIRKNLIRICLRDVLLKAGIPTEWITPEVLVTSSRVGGVSGLHLRLRIKRWDERLPGCALALQRQFEQRIVSLDPMAPEWLTGMSWQFAMDEEPPIPALPHPSTWTRKPLAQV